MLKLITAVAAVALSASSLPLVPAEVGTASATLEAQGTAIDLRRSVAVLRDNAEGLMENQRVIRVLLSDHEASASSLVGVAFPPVLSLARQGQLRGMLLEFDPSDRTRMRVTLLTRPEDDQVTLATVSLTNSEGLWQSLQVTSERVQGSFNGGTDGIPSFRFSAPLLIDAVVEDLKGAEAQKSTALQVLLARAEAVRAGDSVTAVRLSSSGSATQLQSLSPSAMKQVAAGMGELINGLKKAKRVVVRKQSATVLLSEGSFASAVLENGSWKAAD